MTFEVTFSLECSIGWTSFGGAECYKYFSKASIPDFSWDDARKACETISPHNSDLASVSDKETNDNLKKIPRDSSLDTVSGVRQT